MTSPDIDKLISRLDPARSASIPEPDSITGRRIRKRALARAGGSRGYRRGAAVGVVAAIAVLGGTAAAVLLTTGSSPNPVQALCYAEPDLQADAVGSTVGTTANVADCYRFWQDGTFASNGVVPTLTACVLNGGGLAVLPGGADLCASLGLADSDTGSAADPIVELQSRLRTLVPLGSCAPFAETVASMANVVSSVGPTAWELSVRDEPSDDRPCASFSLEGDTMTVVVVPIPDPS